MKYYIKEIEEDSKEIFLAKKKIDHKVQVIFQSVFV